MTVCAIQSERHFHVLLLMLEIALGALWDFTHPDPQIHIPRPTATQTHSYTDTRTHSYTDTQAQTRVHTHTTCLFTKSHRETQYGMNFCGTALTAPGAPPLYKCWRI